jgi:hypothetical protein
LWASVSFSRATVTFEIPLPEADLRPSLLVHAVASQSVCSKDSKMLSLIEKPSPEKHNFHMLETEKRTWVRPTCSIFEQWELGGVMEGASAQPQDKLSFLPSISLKN